MVQKFSTVTPRPTMVPRPIETFSRTVHRSAISTLASIAAPRYSTTPVPTMQVSPTLSGGSSCSFVVALNSLRFIGRLPSVA